MQLCSQIRQGYNASPPEVTMAITIRNKETEDMVRRIGKRWGAGPSAVVKRLAEKELAQNGRVSPPEYAKRMKVFEDLARDFPPQDPKPAWEELEAEMQAMFDYLDDEPGQS
jgi:hypothetical protein